MVEDRASETTLLITGRPRGVVLTFRPRRLDGRRKPRGAAKTAEETAGCLIQLYEGRDAVLNAAWDSLMTLVVEAWCWRDPDCLAAVEVCIENLRRTVDEDWS